MEISAGVGHLGGQAEVPVLLVLHAETLHALNQSRSAGQQRIALRRGSVLEIHKRRKRRIERGDTGPQLRYDASSGTHAVAPRQRHRAGVVDADTLQADAFRARRHAETDASQSSSTLGAPQHLLGQQRPIALHLDVNIVFDRQRHHILRGQI